MTIEELKNYIDLSLQKKEISPFVGILSSELPLHIQKKAKRLANADIKKFIITANEIRHAYNKHNDEKKEAKRNQKALTPTSMLFLADTLLLADNVDNEDGNVNLKYGNCLRFTKRDVDGTLYWVFVLFDTEGKEWKNQTAYKHLTGTDEVYGKVVDFGCEIYDVSARLDRLNKLVNKMPDNDKESLDETKNKNRKADLTDGFIESELVITIEKSPTSKLTAYKPQGDYTPYTKCQQSSFLTPLGDLINGKDTKEIVSGLKKDLKNWSIDNVNLFVLVMANKIGAEPSKEIVEYAEEVEEISYYLNLPQYSLRLGLHKHHTTMTKLDMIKQQRSYSKELKQFFAKTFKGVFIYITTPKDYLLEHHIPQLPIVIRPKTLHEHMESHDLIRPDIKQLNTLINNPLFIYDTKHGNLVGKVYNLIVAKVKEKDSLLCCTLYVDQTMNKIQVNNISSISPRHIDRLISWNYNGLLKNAEDCDIEKIKTVVSDSCSNCSKCDNLISSIEYCKGNAKSDKNKKGSENNSLGMAFIGAKGIRNYNEALLNKDKAERMETAGWSVDDIKMTTGWERGADMRWRYEVPDFAVDDVHFKRIMLRPNLHLVDFIDYDKRDLFKQLYDPISPNILNMPVYIKKLKGGDLGYFSYRGSEPDSITIDVAKTIAWGYSPQSTINHEIQHLIQFLEGFENGTNSSKKTFEKYQKKAGEWEARMVQQRMFMTEEQRAASILRAEKEDKTGYGVRDLWFEFYPYCFLCKVNRQSLAKVHV